MSKHTDALKLKGNKEFERFCIERLEALKVVFGGETGVAIQAGIDELTLSIDNR